MNETFGVSNNVNNSNDKNNKLFSTDNSTFIKS